MSATVINADVTGVWVQGAAALAESSGALQNIQNPIFFLPWTSVDWIVMKDGGPILVRS